MHEKGIEQQAPDLIELTGGVLELAKAIEIIEKFPGDRNRTADEAFEFLASNSNSTSGPSQAVDSPDVPMPEQAHHPDGRIRRFSFHAGPTEDHSAAADAQKAYYERVTKNVGLGIKTEVSSEDSVFASKEGKQTEADNQPDTQESNQSHIEVIDLTQSRETSVAVSEGLFVTPNLPNSPDSPDLSTQHTPFPRSNRPAEDASGSSSRVSDQDTPMASSQDTPRTRQYKTQETSRQPSYRRVYNRLWKKTLPYQEDWDAAMTLENVTPATFERLLTLTMKKIEDEATKRGVTPDFTFPNKPLSANKGQFRHGYDPRRIAQTSGALRTYAYPPPGNKADDGTDNDDDLTDDDPNGESADEVALGERNEQHDENEPEDTAVAGRKAPAKRYEARSRTRTGKQPAYRAVDSRLREDRLPYQEDWDEVIALIGVIPANFERLMKPIRERIEAEAREQGVEPDLSFPRLPETLKKRRQNAIAKKAMQDEADLKTESQVDDDDDDDDESIVWSDDEENDDLLHQHGENTTDEDTDHDDEDQTPTKQKAKGKQKEVDDGQINRDEDAAGAQIMQTRPDGPYQAKEETEKNVAHLRQLFPTASRNTCLSELQIQSGDLAETIKELKKHFWMAEQSKKNGNESPSIKRTNDQAFVSIALQLVEANLY